MMDVKYWIYDERWDPVRGAPPGLLLSLGDGTAIEVNDDNIAHLLTWLNLPQTADSRSAIAAWIESMIRTEEWRRKKQAQEARDA